MQFPYNKQYGVVILEEKSSQSVDQCLFKLVQTTNIVITSHDTRQEGESRVHFCFIYILSTDLYFRFVCHILHLDYSLCKCYTSPINQQACLLIL